MYLTKNTVFDDKDSLWLQRQSLNTKTVFDYKDSLWLQRPYLTTEAFFDYRQSVTTKTVFDQRQIKTVFVDIFEVWSHPEVHSTSNVVFLIVAYSNWLLSVADFH